MTHRVFDFFLRASSVPTLRTVLNSDAFKGNDEGVRGFVGDLFDPDDPNRLVDIRFVAAQKLFPPNTVVITPAVLDDEGEVVVPAILDSSPWLHLRLLRDAVLRDMQPGTGTDRWNKSRLIQHLRDNGVVKTIRGVRVLEMLVGGGWIQIWRSSKMEDAGVKFHEFSGGNFD